MPNEYFIMNTCRYVDKSRRPLPLPEAERFNHEATESHGGHS